MNFCNFDVKQWNLPNSQITNFDVAIVGVDVNALAVELSVNKLVLVKKCNTLEQLIAPVFDDYQSGQSDLA